VSRNTGISAATSPWIAILDGDDTFLPGRLARCLLRAKKFNADIVVDDLIARRESDGSEYPMFPAFFSHLDMLTLDKFMSVKRFFSGSRRPPGYLKPMFRAAFLRQHGLGYDPGLRIGEDYLLMCEALASGARCAVEPTAGYLYTVRANSISSRLTKADVDGMASGDKKVSARYKLGPAAARMQKRQEHDLQEYCAYVKLADALKRRDIIEALRAVAERPLTVRHLWQPAWRRAEFLLKEFRERAFGADAP
jgi:succinoglycan biosynthesis protein ExoO